MGFSLQTVVPWGRSFEEYVGMFDLSPADLTRRILGCGDGPASFNAELAERGGQMVSVDPIYEFNAEQIRNRIDETYGTVMEQLRANRDDYVWEIISSPNELGRIRMKAMETFLTDFESGKTAGRYIAGELPDLPFPDKTFDLALCSHFLFLYSNHLSLDFHVNALLEMMRVAGEARIFPLLTLDGKLSPHLTPAIQALNAHGIQCRIQSVPYEFQKGGNKALFIVQTGQTVSAQEE